MPQTVLTRGDAKTEQNIKSSPLEIRLISPRVNHPFILAFEQLFLTLDSSHFKFPSMLSFVYSGLFFWLLRFQICKSFMLWSKIFYGFDFSWHS